MATKTDEMRSLPAFNDAKKQVVSDVLDVLGGEDCTPDMLMDAASDEDHEMHDGFGFLWDNEQAAYQYNHRVAYNLIRITWMRTRNSRKSPARVSRFWSIRGTTDDGKIERELVNAKRGIKNRDYSLQQLVQYQRHLCGMMRNNIDFLATQFPFCEDLADAIDAFDDAVESEMKKAEQQVAV